MGRYVYNVRQNSTDGTELGTYQHPGPSEPGIGDEIYLDGKAGRWRVTDSQRNDTAERDPWNIIIVEETD